MTDFAWGYASDNGPHVWSNHFPIAGGSRQSPIDIRTDCVKSSNNNNNKLKWKYNPEKGNILLNNGHSWHLQFSQNKAVLAGGPLEDEYTLEQMHCHWGRTDCEGSEHTIDGKQYAAELHIVHWNSSKYQSFQEAVKHPDGLCVLGVLLEVGNTNKELHKITSLLSKIEMKGQSVAVPHAMEPGNLLPNNCGYYTYPGSLTTPPCLECVQWIVFKKPLEISSEQLAAFRNMKTYASSGKVPDDEFNGYLMKNYRPTLPVGDREVIEY